MSSVMSQQLLSPRQPSPQQYTRQQYTRQQYITQHLKLLPVYGDLQAELLSRSTSREIRPISALRSLNILASRTFSTSYTAAFKMSIDTVLSTIFRGTKLLSLSSLITFAALSLCFSTRFENSLSITIRIRIKLTVNNSHPRLMYIATIKLYTVLLTKMITTVIYPKKASLYQTTLQRNLAKSSVNSSLLDIRP